MDVKVGQDAGHTGIPSKGLYVEEVVVTASRGDGVYNSIIQIMI